MPMLNGRLALHNVPDTEHLCRQILRQKAPTLNHADHEDALAYLIAAAWELSLHYNPTIGTFDGYLRRYLPARLIDHQRQRLGRTRWQWSDHTHERTHPATVSLEHTIQPTDGRQLADTLASSHLDDPAHRSTDLGRLLTHRNRPPLRTHHSQSVRTRRRAA